MNEGILIFKTKTKTKNPRYYLYSGDEETLIFVAEKQSDHDHEWIISRDSINLNKTNESFIGILIKAHKNQSKSISSSLSNTYVGIVNNHEIVRVRKIDNSLQNYNISFLKNINIENQTNNIEQHTEINSNSFNDANNSIESLTQANQESYFTQFFEFKYENKICFTLKFCEKDEYFIKYTEPIDNIKAFCAAISIILISEKQNK